MAAVKEEELVMMNRDCGVCGDECKKVNGWMTPVVVVK